MAIPKVIGLETEYGIGIRGAEDPNPIAASSTLINAYAAEVARRVRWDFEDESPGRDARGPNGLEAFPPEVETHMVNSVLTNGARYYVDHAHPEYSGPECATPRETVLFDKAGEVVLARSVEAATRTLPEGQRFVVLKNNSDGKGNTYGTHENYLLDRSVPFNRIVQHTTTHLVTRQIFTGAGKVGCEASVGYIPPDVGFQLTQRADFFEEEVGLETTLKRPIINTRDEPHSNAQRYRRLHLIVGDANLSETATYLKVGTTALVLAMIEDDWYASAGRDYTLADPLRALREVSYDLTLSVPLRLADGRRMTALEIQWEQLELARKYAEDVGTEALGGQEEGQALLSRWEDILSGLESDPMDLADQLDWVAKLRLMEGYKARHGLDRWDDSRLAAFDLQYHDVMPARSLYARVGMQRMFSEQQVTDAVSEPPESTRAYFRGKCLQRWNSSVIAANWDSIVFDLGTDPLRRVPMMEPLRGTKVHVQDLLESVRNPAELLEKLGS